MLTIILLCNLGMSTGILEDKIKEAAEARGLPVKVLAVPYDRADDILNTADILLLGPQVRYHLLRFQKDYAGKIPVIDVMNFSDYGLANGEKILADALVKYKANKP